MNTFMCSVIFCCCVTSLIYGWRIMNWLWFRPRKLEKLLRQQGFNGNSYRFFYGDLKESSVARKEARSKPMDFSNHIVPRVAPSFHKALTKYGEKCFVWFGPTPAVLILDPEIVREIMSKHYAFPKPSGIHFARLLARGLATLEGDKWAKHRRLINPAFHAEKLKHMVPAFQLSCDEMLSKWEEIVPNEGSCELDVWPYLENMTGDVISRTAFGSCYEQGRKIFALQREQAKHIMEASRSVHIPGNRFLPTRFNRRLEETKSEIDSILLGMIKKRLKVMEQEEEEEAENRKNDLLGILLESNFKQNESGMNIKEVIEECKMFYFAGSETMASLLVWTMILLSKHVGWQGRARDEVVHVFGREKPGHQELNHLKILSMILHEALRLYPPAPMLGRAHQKDCRLGEVMLPAGVMLLIPTILLHHGIKIWGDDAEEFKPERFGEGVSRAGQNGYFPFGWGPRICIGQNLAMLEAKMAMAMILQRYSWEVSPSYAHAPHTVITLQPQYGAHLIVTKL